MTDQPAIVIGVDAGGTKTQALLLREDGRVLGWGIGGPGNPTRVPPDRLRVSLVEAITAVLSSADSPAADTVAAVCLGVAGGRGYRQLIRDTVVQLGISGVITVVSDTDIALWGAISKSYGVVVIAGTGSSAVGAGLDGEIAKAGGRGYLIGDEGSAYDIGRMGIVAALKAEDGRGPATALLDQLMQHFQLDDVEQIIPTIYDPSKDSGRTLISGFAPQVVETAAEGDQVALHILNHAGSELGRSAIAVARKLDLCDREFEVALVGGVFKAGELVISPLRAQVLRAAPMADVFVSNTPPALGAARLALQAIGKDLPRGTPISRSA
ncbi:MAG: BadF/BadG/BcrA/BcrD ATPase family protein [Chloroflexota bacterium]|nr:BadF/BadG/BcrA/BcrD ATPase family protein [Chloroflexota bacterium]